MGVSESLQQWSVLEGLMEGVLRHPAGLRNAIHDRWRFWCRPSSGLLLGSREENNTSAQASTGYMKIPPVSSASVSTRLRHIRIHISELNS